MTIEATEIEGPDRFAELDELVEQLQEALDDPDSVGDTPERAIDAIRKLCSQAFDVADSLTPADYQQFYEEGEGDNDSEETGNEGADYFG